MTHFEYLPAWLMQTGQDVAVITLTAIIGAAVLLWASK